MLCTGTFWYCLQYILDQKVHQSGSQQETDGSHKQGNWEGFNKETIYKNAGRVKENQLKMFNMLGVAQWDTTPPQPKQKREDWVQEPAGSIVSQEMTSRWAVHFGRGKQHPSQLQ